MVNRGGLSTYLQSGMLSGLPVTSFQDASSGYVYKPVTPRGEVGGN